MPNRRNLLLFFVLLTLYCRGQQVPSTSIYFPQPMDKSWKASLGFTFTTTAQEITEEQRQRLPAIDIHFLKRISGAFNFDGRLESDILQNHFSAGPRFVFRLSDKLSLSPGSDIAYWFGLIKMENINYRGHGLIYYPNISIGCKIRDDLLLTIKGELVYNLVNELQVGSININKVERTYSGGALTLVLEQPFFKQKYLSLGFRALYSDFFWGTWFTFEVFDRKLFHPQIIASIIL